MDLDGDGDLDIVACALLAGGSDIDETTLPALVWLEQTRPGVFERHTLEKGAPRHAHLDVGDFDHDGDVDIAVGTFMLVPGSPSVHQLGGDLGEPAGALMRRVRAFLLVVVLGTVPNWVSSWGQSPAPHWGLSPIWELIWRLSPVRRRLTPRATRPCARRA